jgi:hypothetical protein
MYIGMPEGTSRMRENLVYTQYTVGILEMVLMPE